MPATASASSGALTLKRLVQVGKQAANEVESEWSSNAFGYTIVDWSGTCRVTSALRGRCNIKYEFDDGAVCSDVVRVTKRSRKSSRVTYWSDSDKTDDRGADDTFDNCTDATITDPDA
jgi:hypothetical protein